MFKIEAMARMCALLILLMAISTEGIFCTSECKESGIRCADPWTYQLCINWTDYAVGTIDAKKCPAGTICTDVGAFPCKVGTITTTTTPAPTTVPTCTAATKSPVKSSCNTYYECVQILLWWQLNVNTCPSGQNFNPSTSTCVSAAEYPCGNVATTAATVTTPQCTGAGKLPGPTASQYYECQFIWFVWQPQLKSCADGEVFNHVTSECGAAA